MAASPSRQFHHGRRRAARPPGQPATAPILAWPASDFAASNDCTTISTNTMPNSATLPRLNISKWHKLCAMLRFPNGCSTPRKPTARSAASTGRRVRSWPLTPTSPSGHSFCPMAARRTSAGRRTGPAEPPESRPKATEPTVTIDSRPARVRVSSVGRRNPPIRGRARRRCRPGQAIGCRLRRGRGVRCRVGAAVEGSEAGVRALKGAKRGCGRRRERSGGAGVAETLPGL